MTLPQDPHADPVVNTAQSIEETWKKVKAERDALVPEPAEGFKRRSLTQQANAQGQSWRMGLERFVRHNPQEVCDELTEMGIGTFARGILLAMEGPVCPMCHRGGEPWAYQTFAKVAKVLGDDTLQALALKTMGVSLEVIQSAVKLHQSVGHATPEENDRLAQEYLQSRGWHCLPPGAEVKSGDAQV